MLLLATNRTETVCDNACVILDIVKQFLHLCYNIKRVWFMIIPLDGNRFPQIARDPDPFQY